MYKAFKYRLYPNTNQARELDIMLNTHRHLYNECLDQRNKSWETTQTGIKYSQQSAWFKLARKENPYFARINFSSAQATLRRLDKAFQNFFRRVKNKEEPGYPRFKARDRFDSFMFPSYNDGIKLINSKLRIQNIGQVICNFHRPIEGKIKTISILKEGEKWFAIFTCDIGEIIIPQSNNPPIGIDVGIESFLTTSDNTKVENPKFFKIKIPEIRRRSRAVSRKKKKGKNKKKAVKRLRYIHAKVKNCRRDFHHKTALQIVRSYGLVAVESLNIKGMVRNRRLAQAISDASWGSFLIILKHKAESAGVRVIEVSARNTSQVCSQCGTLVPKKLSVRWHCCPNCSFSCHRDTNSAIEILNRSLVRKEPMDAKATVG